MAWPEEEGATRGEAQLRGSLPAALQGEGAARDKDPVDRTTQASLHARERVSTYNKLSRLCWFPLPRRTAPSRAQLPSRNRGCSGRLGVSPARGRRCHTVHSIGARPGRTGPCLTRGASHPALGRRSRGGGRKGGAKVQVRRSDSAARLDGGHQGVRPRGEARRRRRVVRSNPERDAYDGLLIIITFKLRAFRAIRNLVSSRGGSGPCLPIAL